MECGVLKKEGRTLVVITCVLMLLTLFCSFGILFHSIVTVKMVKEDNMRFECLSAKEEDFYYFWNGSYSEIIDPNQQNYWEGCENFTYIGSNEFLVNESRYHELPNQTYNYSRKVNNQTRIISEQTGGLWIDGSHEWVWIPTNISLHDEVNITVYNQGDSVFNVTGETVIPALGRNFTAWVLTDSLGSTAYYDKYSGILINGTFLHLFGLLNYSIYVTNTNVTLEPNNNAPCLEDGNVNPIVGFTTTIFNFTVNYSDADNNEPFNIDVVINGTPYSLAKENESDDNYLDGVIYFFETYLQEGNYSHHYSCFDNTFSNQTSEIIGPNVTLVNLNPPVLDSGAVSPNSGFNTTIFEFSVNYSDSDNNEPAYVNVTINSTKHQMQKLNPLDDIYLDGVLYFYNTTLPGGNYEFYFNASDGLNPTGLPQTNVFYGPIVKILKNYSIYKGVTFDWINITDGTALSLTDDDSSTQVLPFDFPFYNETYSTIHISSNGYCSFTNSAPVDHTEDPIPSTDLDNQRLIALLWDDLYPSGGSTLYVKNLTSPNRWILEYHEIRHQGVFGVDEGTFQLILYESGEIRFQFLEINYMDGCTSGLNFGDGTLFNVVDNLAVGLKNYSVLFVFDGSLNNTPTLNPLGLDKSQGTPTDTFTFSVEYFDLDNEAPLYVRVIVDGISHEMQKLNASDINYTDGVIYYFSTTLTAGSHVYYFEASDGFYVVREPFIGYSQGPKVELPPNTIFFIILIIFLAIFIPSLGGIALGLTYYYKKRKKSPSSDKKTPLIKAPLEESLKQADKA